MTAKSPELPPIACTLASPEFKVRLGWIARLNAAALRDHHRDGLRLELTYAPEALEQVREMVRREQQCCAFLTFDMHEEQDVVRVIIHVPEAAREVAEIVFESFRAKAPIKADAEASTREQANGCGPECAGG